MAFQRQSCSSSVTKQTLNKTLNKHNKISNTNPVCGNNINNITCVAHGNQFWYDLVKSIDQIYIFQLEELCKPFL